MRNTNPLQEYTNNPTSPEQEVSLGTFYFITLSHVLLPVVAEYLAKGYKLSDQILERAIDMDSTYFHSF